MHDADAVPRRQIVGQRAGAVRRAVVDDDQLAVDAVRGEHLEDRLDQLAEAGALVVGGHDDGEPHAPTIAALYLAAVTAEPASAAPGRQSPRASLGRVAGDRRPRRAAARALPHRRSAVAHHRRRRLARRGRLDPQRPQPRAVGHVADRRLEPALRRAGLHRPRVRRLRHLRRRHLAGAPRADDARRDRGRRARLRRGADRRTAGRPRRRRSCSPPTTSARCTTAPRSWKARWRRSSSSAGGRSPGRRSGRPGAPSPASRRSPRTSPRPRRSSSSARSASPRSSPSRCRSRRGRRSRAGDRRRAAGLWTLAGLAVAGLVALAALRRAGVDGVPLLQLADVGDAQAVLRLRSRSLESRRRGSRCCTTCCRGCGWSSALGLIAFVARALDWFRRSAGRAAARALGRRRRRRAAAARRRQRAPLRVPDPGVHGAGRARASPPIAPSCRTGCAPLRGWRRLLFVPLVLYAAYVVSGSLVRLAFLYDVRPAVRRRRPRSALRRGRRGLDLPAAADRGGPPAVDAARRR